MGYDNMDHAGWVERNIEAAKKNGSGSSAEKKRAAEGKGWLAAPDKLDPFHARVFTIIGVIGGGIYNAPINWETIYWRQKDALFVDWQRELSTIDFSALTTAVFLAHDASIRLTIKPKMRDLQMMFHGRSRHVEGQSLSVGHPSLEHAIATHRERFPASHHVHLEQATTQELVDG